MNKKRKWHSVKECMPEINKTLEHSKDVIVREDRCDNHGIAWLTLQENGTTAWGSFDSDIDLNCITHWCEIPEFDGEEDKA